MARPKKTFSLDEQLENVISEIETLEVNLKEKKALKKDLEAQIKMNRLSELDEIITASGKSFEEVKKLLNKKE